METMQSGLITTDEVDVHSLAHLVIHSFIHSVSYLSIYSLTPRFPNFPVTLATPTGHLHLIAHAHISYVHNIFSQPWEVLRVLK